MRRIIDFLTSLVYSVILRRRAISLKKITFRQSLIHESVKSFLPSNSELRKKVKTQSSILREKNTLRIVYAPDNKAYWISGNAFYYAEIIDGHVDMDNAQQINAESLSKKEIDRLLYILDSLRNG